MCSKGVTKGRSHHAENHDSDCKLGRFAAPNEDIYGGT
jgi:hypothetical protein